MRERDVVDDDVRTAKQSLRRCLETRHVTSLGQQGGGRRVFWGAVSILDLSEFFFRTMSNTFLGEKKFPGGFAPLVETLLETLTIINRNELQPFKSISNATAYYDTGGKYSSIFLGLTHHASSLMTCAYHSGCSRRVAPKKLSPGPVSSATGATGSQESNFCVDWTSCGFFYATGSGGADVNEGVQNPSCAASCHSLRACTRVAALTVLPVAWTATGYDVMQNAGKIASKVGKEHFRDSFLILFFLYTDDKKGEKRRKTQTACTSSRVAFQGKYRDCDLHEWSAQPP